MAIINLQTAQINQKFLNDQIWSDMLLEMIKLESSEFIFGTLGMVHSIPKNAGTKVISLRRYNSLATSADGSGEKLAEGVAPDPLIIDGQMVSGTIDEFGAYMELTNWTQDIHMDDIKSIYMPELARHAAEVKERNIMSKFTEASTYIVDSTGATNASINDLVTADVLKIQDIRKVALAMKNYKRAGHPKFGGKTVIAVHPNVMQDLLDDQDLEDKVLVPGNDNSPIKSGTLTQYLIYGFYVIETLLAQVQQNSGGYKVYTSYLLGKDPYTVISLGKEGVKWFATGFEADKSDPLGQHATFGYRFWSGAKMIDPLAMTLIYSCSAYSAALADPRKDAWGRTVVQYDNIPAECTVGSISTVVTTQEVALTLKDGDGDAISALADGYVVVWTSSDPAVATVANKTVSVAADLLKAVVTGVADGTCVITAEVKRITPFGTESFATSVTDDSATVTVNVA